MVRIKHDVAERGEGRVGVRLVEVDVEPAPPIAPDRSAAISAGSSTTVPRATLTSVPSGPSAASTGAEISPRVPSPPGHRHQQDVRPLGQRHQVGEVR